MDDDQGKVLKVYYDKETDVQYMGVRDGPVHDSEELDDDLRVQYDKKGRIVGIEVLDARRNLGKVMAQEIAQRVKAVTR